MSLHRKAYLSAQVRKVRQPREDFHFRIERLHLVGEVGKALCKSKLVRKLSFTGSTRVSKLLEAQCSNSLKELSFELGGNSLFNMLDDAKLEIAVKAYILAKFRTSHLSLNLNAAADYRLGQRKVSTCIICEATAWKIQLTGLRGALPFPYNLSSTFCPQPISSTYLGRAEV